MTETQNAQILAHLKAGHSITAFDALAMFDCLRLSGRIYDLKQAGHAIEKRMVETSTGKRVARYRLAQ